MESINIRFAWIDSTSIWICSEISPIFFLAAMTLEAVFQRFYKFCVCKWIGIIIFSFFCEMSFSISHPISTCPYNLDGVSSITTRTPGSLKVRAPSTRYCTPNVVFLCRPSSHKDDIIFHIAPSINSSRQGYCFYFCPFISSLFWQCNDFNHINICL